MVGEKGKNIHFHLVYSCSKYDIVALLITPDNSNLFIYFEIRRNK